MRHNLALVIVTLFSVPSLAMAQKPQLMVQTGYANLVVAVAFSHDGKVLRETATLKTPKVGVEAVTISSDGKTVATGNGDYTVTLWETATGNESLVLKGRTNAVTSIVSSSNGRTWASGSVVGLGRSDAIRIWDAPTGQLVKTLTGQPVGRELASLLAVGQQDWLVVTPDGLFDGSPSAWNQILWRFSQKRHS